MTLEETLSVTFQPGMSDVFLLGFSFAFMSIFLFVLIACLGDLIMCLIHRFIWPCKQDVTQTQDPGTGAAG